MSRQDKSDNASDDTLWDQLAQTVQAKGRSRLFHPDAVTAQPKRQAISKRQSASQPSHLPTTAGKPTASKKGSTPADLRLGERAGLDRASQRRLTSGKYDIDDRLDLHGLYQEDAHRRLISFIENAVARQMRTLLVITGKGRHGQGVLRQKVPFWLKQPPLSAHILAINEATGRDGGAGALYVRLRRRRET